MPPSSRVPSIALLRQFSLITSRPLPPQRVSSPSICHACSRPLPSQQRPFSSTSTFQKKSAASKKSARKTPEVSAPDVDRHVPNNKATQNEDAEIDPYDFTTLQADIDKALSRLSDALTRSRDAGRVSAAMIEALPVEVNVKGADTSGGNAHKEKMRVGDIASVVPKGGRAMQVFCSEEPHVKPVTNAIQASDYSLTPEPPQSVDSGGNPLCIVVPVPPVTAETRSKAKEEAKKVIEKAGLEVNKARGEAQKKFRKMELGKLVVVDELRKAHKGMEEVVKRGQDDVKKVGEGALKALER